MGLIKALASATGSVLADQWKEYFYCDALETDVLAVKGKKRVSGGSSNTKGSDNIITNGSAIAVADGQCMIIVEQGKVAEICAEPGVFTYDNSTEPSIFSGGLGKGIIESFKNLGKRFTYGGQPANDQRVYYFNTKEIVGNKYGTPQPVPFRVVDERAAIDMDIAISCFGEYSYKLIDPILFYTNVCGNVEDDYTRDKIDSQMKSELLTKLGPTFAEISGMGIRYSSLMAHQTEMADILKKQLSEDWQNRRGIEIVAFGISSLKANEEDEKIIKSMQRDAAYMDPTRGAAATIGARTDAMRDAANNEGAGAAMAFMGMNMAQGMGADVQNLYAQGQAMQAQQQNMSGGGANPQQAGGWNCPNCKKIVFGKFCTECGTKKPDDAPDGWTCTCGAVNKGKFCSECGAPKPAGAPQYRCDKCGWEPEDPTNPPKFCPECGDPFGDEDIVK